MAPPGCPLLCCSENTSRCRHPFAELVARGQQGDTGRLRGGRGELGLSSGPADSGCPAGAGGNEPGEVSSRVRGPQLSRPRGSASMSFFVFFFFNSFFFLLLILFFFSFSGPRGKFPASGEASLRHPTRAWAPCSQLPLLLPLVSAA